MNDALRWVVMSLTVSLPAAADGPPPTHCLGDETLFFSCVLDSGKVVSLCGEPPRWLSYRVGRPGKIELAYPPRGEAKRFTWERRVDGSGTSYLVRFKVKGLSYTVYEHEGPDPEPGSGVMVERKRKVISTSRCTDSPRAAMEPLESWVPHQKVKVGSGDAAR